MTDRPFENLSLKPIARERRRSQPSPAEAEKPKRLLLAPFVNGFKLHDIASTKHHSDDFIETRAEFIALRLRFMVAFYALAVPLWIPVDFYLLSPEHFAAMLVPRLCLSAFLIGLLLLSLRRHGSLQVHAILLLSILASGLFYAASMLILSEGAAEPFLGGYSFMPFMIIAMIGIFPLTLNWGVALMGAVILIHLALLAFMGRLMTADTANSLWILIVLAGIGLWVQSSQLLMLLRLYRESTQDPLTGLINRRVLMKRLTTEIEHVKNGGPGFCIEMFDLDRFKRINDNYGHLIGDTVLRTTAELLKQGLRKQDIIARFGGEEFVAMLPNCKSTDAVAVAERIRQSCQETRVGTPDGKSIQLSTSVGVTEYEADESVEATLNRVDDSLYKAKELGRNRVVYSQSAEREATLRTLSASA